MSPAGDAQELLSSDELVARLRAEGVRRYHDQHPFHQRMHEGKLSRAELQTWTLNRYYYQTRIPIKDAIIVSKSEEPAFRRAWIRRIHDHDGDAPDTGGLAQWLRLAEAVGLDRDEVASCRRVLPGVRFACDSYVTLCRESPLVVAVASSLTEMFAPDLMSKRIAAWEAALPLGRCRGARLLPRPRAARAPRRRRGARVRGRQRHLARAAGSLRGGAGAQDGDPLAPGRLREAASVVAAASSMIGPDSRVSLARQARLKLDPRTGRQMLLYPEKGLELNETAARVAALCREERAVRDIVERMVAAAIQSPTARRQIEDEVLAFLRALEDRGLLMVRNP